MIDWANSLLEDDDDDDGTDGSISINNNLYILHNFFDGRSFMCHMRVWRSNGIGK